MEVLGADRVDCAIFTFKEGALSAIAHDLHLRATRLSITVGDDRSIDARFDAGSLTVVSAMRDGRPHDALSRSDKATIERTIIGDVLEAKRYPEIAFRCGPVSSSTGGFVAEGTLALHGVVRPLRLISRAEGGRQVAEVTIHQPDFGIRPYRAFLGTLRVQPDVKVRISL